MHLNPVWIFLRSSPESVGTQSGTLVEILRTGPKRFRAQFGLVRNRSGLSPTISRTEYRMLCWQESGYALYSGWSEIFRNASKKIPDCAEFCAAARDRASIGFELVRKGSGLSTEGFRTESEASVRARNAPPCTALSNIDNFTVANVSFYGRK